MTFLINKKFMILAIFLVSLLAVSAVNAADNATEDIAGVEKTADEVISVNENQTISEDDVLGDSPGTFTDLANEIAKAGSTLNLNRNYVYTDSDSSSGYWAGITIDKSIKINGNGHTITAKDNAGSLKITASNVVLNNINFRGFEHSYPGAAISWSGNNGVLSNCNFMNCSIAPGAGFYHGGNKGGAVFWEGSSGTLSDCSFTDCHADSGGAVYWDGDSGILSGCSFTDCYSDTITTAGGDGGAIYWEGSDGKVDDCIFMNCYGEHSGGAVFWLGSNGNLANSKFVNCYSSQSGGAVKWQDYGVLSNCEFMDCHANNGGGAVNWVDAEGVLSNCDFIGCHANNGGAVYFSTNRFSSGCGSITESSFTNCRAKYDGGGIYFDNAIYNSGNYYSLINPTFEGNTASRNGSDWYSKEPVYVVIKTKTVLSAPNVSTTVGTSKNLVVTLTDANKNALAGEQISINLNNVDHTLKTNSKGQVSLAIPTDLAPKTYVATIRYAGNEKYGSSTTSAKVIVNKIDTKLTAKYDAGSKNIVTTVKDANGNPLSGVKVGFAIGGVKYVTTDANGQAKYSTAGLADGTYKVTVQASGNEIYKDSNKETVTFTIGSKEMSKIFLRNALYFVTQTKLVQVTLWDGNNQPLAGKTVYIRAYDSVWHGVTDENGDAFVRVGIGFGTHDATVSFDGDDQYNASTRAGYIRVIKQTPSVMVRGADTMFKATNPLKIVKVHLRDRYDQPLPEGSKIVLKLNCKTYIGFTDAEGVARIAININTVGTFTAQAMYGGNTAYNPVTRDVKIRIV